MAIRFSQKLRCKTEEEMHAKDSDYYSYTHTFTFKDKINDLSNKQFIILHKSSYLYNNLYDNKVFMKERDESLSMKTNTYFCYVLREIANVMVQCRETIG